MNESLLQVELAALLLRRAASAVAGEMELT